MLGVETLEALLPLLRHIVDFGLVVLIWLVQLIIYPSFSYTAKDELQTWHQRYVARITVVVGPLMLLQVLIVAMQVFVEGGWSPVCSLVLVGLCWLSSFGLSIPCHRRIEQGQASGQVLERLVHSNWPRTVLWTVVFAIGFV